MAKPDTRYAPRGLFIGGEWKAGVEGTTFETINPANGERLGTVPYASAKDVERAVDAAEQAYPAWSRAPIKDRAACLSRLAERIEAEAEDLSVLDAVDSGNAVHGMLGDMAWTADSLRYFAGLITEIKGETSSQGDRHLNLARRQPFGVVAKINPFNHPFRFCAEKAAAPLAAGNCVVIKGSEQAPLSSLRLGELCQDIFPPGVINILAGDGVTGSALVRHPRVRRIGFVGSVPTGRRIAREAAEQINTVSLELGGKNPMIIFPDVEPEKAAKAAIKGMNMNRQGQSCSSTSRIMVHESIHRPVLDALIAEAEALPVGLPWLEETEVGPLISENQFNRVMDYIQSGKEDGARLVTGGGKPADSVLAKGFFVVPTIFDGVTADMRIAREEIFGPVMSVMPWRDYEEMLAWVNDVDYGLTAAILTKDLGMAMETAERVEAGYVWINSAGRYLGAAYGGWKQSGIGREECLEELLSYTQIKNVNMRW